MHCCHSASQSFQFQRAPQKETKFDKNAASLDAKEDRDAYAIKSQAVNAVAAADPQGRPTLAEIRAKRSMKEETEDSGRQWADLVNRIQNGETDGMEELYRLFSKEIRSYLSPHGSQGLEERLRDALALVIQAIRRGEVQEPERLLDFVRTVVNRHEEEMPMKRVLGELSDRDREILTRFYLQEQSQSKICLEMGLSETYFRLLKSRTKARFEELRKRKAV